MSKSRLQHQREERLAKVARLREIGINPFPAQSQKDQPNQEIVDNFDEHQGKEVSLTGRLMSLREHGKVAFGDLEDQSGRIQLFIRADQVGETDSKAQTLGFKDILKLVDPGDFVQAKGEVVKTKTGQISLQVSQLKMGTKSIRPLPSTHEEIKDKEFKFRRRYVDLTLNPERREMFERKAKFWRVNREFMYQHDFIEVETPVLEHVTGGADARPFVTYMNTLDQDFYLRISTELYQKRLIGGGLEKIFTLGPNFRNEGLSDEHLTEYSQIEWYWAYADYEDNMRLVEAMFKHIGKEVYGKTKFTTRGHTFDLDQDWERISYPDVIKEKLGIDIFEDDEAKMLEVIKEHQVELSGAINKSRLIDNLWKLIRKEISGPAFLINEPAFMSPLSKSKTSDPRLTERFHIIIAGSELGNGYSELNDPVDQLDRFMEQQSARDAGDDEAQMMDIDFVEMLEYGMPPTSGYGHSERLFWFLEDVTAREGTLFPALRHKIEKTTQEIYGIKPAVKQEVKKGDQVLTLASDFASQYPSASAAYAIIEGVNITRKDPELEVEKQELLENYSNLDTKKLGEYPEIQSYRQMYKQMGVDWHSRRPSPEALLRRVALGKGLYSINTCVDAYNLIVMKNRVSIGAFDLDQIQLPVELTIGQGGEQILLLGDDAPTEINAGEVFYQDQKGPYNLDYNYRDAQRTKVTDKTKNIWVNVEGVYDISPEKVQETLEETIEIIQKYCGGKVVDKGLLAAS